MRPVPLLASLLVLLSGCGLLGLSNEADLRLSTDRSTYALDDDLELRLYNGTDGPVGYNLCSTGLERRAGSAWTVVPNERACTAELRLAAPGTRASATFSVAGYFEGADFEAGTYRLTTRVEVSEESRRLATGAFVLTE